MAGLSGCMVPVWLDEAPLRMSSISIVECGGAAAAARAGSLACRARWRRAPTSSDRLLAKSRKVERVECGAADVVGVSVGGVGLAGVLVEDVVGVSVGGVGLVGVLVDGSVGWVGFVVSASGGARSVGV